MAPLPIDRAGFCPLMVQDVGPGSTVQVTELASKIRWDVQEDQAEHIADVLGEVGDLAADLCWSWL